MRRWNNIVAATTTPNSLREQSEGSSRSTDRPHETGTHAKFSFADFSDRVFDIHHPPAPPIPPSDAPLPGYRSHGGNRWLSSFPRTVLEDWLQLWGLPGCYSIHVWPLRAIEHVSGGPRALRSPLNLRLKTSKHMLLRVRISVKVAPSFVKSNYINS